MNEDIPAHVIERYRKYRAMARQTESPMEARKARELADKLEREHPDLRERVDFEERVKAKAAEFRGESAPNVPRPQDVPPPVGASWADTLRRASLRLVGVDPVQWAAEKVEQGIDDYVRWLVETGADDSEFTFDNFMKGFTTMTILKSLKARATCEVEDGEDDDGVEYLVITLEIPVELFDRVRGDKTGPKDLVQWIAAVVNEEADDDTDDED